MIISFGQVIVAPLSQKIKRYDEVAHILCTERTADECCDTGTVMLVSDSICQQESEVVLILLISHSV